MSSLIKRLSLLSILFVSACSADRDIEVKYRGLSMGTNWVVKIVSEQGYSPEVAEAIQAELDDVNALMSNWLDTSDISRFNQSEPNTCTEVSKPTLIVVSASQRISELSDSAFDISLSPLIELWGFGTKFKVDDPPTEEQVSEGLAQMGIDNIRSTETELCKSDQLMQLNVSGVAKGYAVDQVAEMLDQKGFTDYLIEVGGELRARGKNGRSAYWTIGIEQPTEELGVVAVQTALPLIDGAVATSGDYRIYYELDGKRYSHIINPVTGYPVTHNAASVTVLANSSMEADAWATALLVLGSEKGIEIANEQRLAVLMILRNDNGYTVVTSDEWPHN